MTCPNITRRNFSSLKHLLQYLSKHLMTNTEITGRGENILASVVNMAKVLEMPVIAEGVEKESQVRFLKNIGCEYVQGYYYAKPMPAEEYEKMLFRDEEQALG